MLLEAPAIAGQSMVLEQEYRYTYERPIRSLRHRILAVPRERHGAQERTTWDLTVSGASVKRRELRDRFGNHVVEFAAARVPEELTFTIRSTVSWATDGRGGAERGATGTGIDDLGAPSPLTTASDELLEVAAELRGCSTSVAEFTERACTWTAGALVYEYGVTGVRTTAAAAIEGGRGVCQDYAHVMLALCRAAKIPTRYVSGHLVGEGGSHAWVEAFTGTEWLAFDPTHARRTDHRYLTVAIGREYSDVAPTSGTFCGGGPGVLASRKRLSVLDSST